MAQRRLTLLDAFEARDAGDVLALPGPKAQALLAYLAFPLRRSHPRDTAACVPLAETSA